MATSKKSTTPAAKSRRKAVKTVNYGGGWLSASELKLVPGGAYSKFPYAPKAYDFYLYATNGTVEAFRQSGRMIAWWSPSAKTWFGV